MGGRFDREEAQMAVRIGSGGMRGRAIETPAGKGTRPLLARIKKSLFDILRPRLPGARILDVFAGSGSFGIEALSQGAATAVLVESDRAAARVITGNADRLGVADRVSVVLGDGANAMRDLAGDGGVFEVIFIDPPFALECDVQLLEAAGSLLDPEGVVVIRIPSKRTLPATAGMLALAREKVYGVSRLGFYRRVLPGAGDTCDHGVQGGTR
jgi:16S rRNA (guanine(966)-N(2))-methyltransferase RsmD